MSQFRLLQIYSAVLAGMRVRSGYRAPIDFANDLATTVWDGPEIRTSDDYAAGGHLIIGWSGDNPDERAPAGVFELDRGPIAATNRPRNEAGSILCKAVGQQNDTPDGARAAAGLIVADLAAFCRADPSLGIDTADTIGGVRSMVYVTEATLTQYLKNGFTAEIDFTLGYSARN